jgi:hypothetical protein
MTPFVSFCRQLDNNKLTCIDEAAVQGLKDLEVL